MNKVEALFDFETDTIEEYISALKELQHKTSRDKRTLEIAEQLFKGCVVINVRETIVEGGFFENGMPKLALARADAELVSYRAKRGRCRFYAPGNMSGWAYRLIDNRIPECKPKLNHNAVVPVVPPKIRPDDTLRNYSILFEVVEWRPMSREADPILLKHLADDLYIVVAEWDMTPLEAFVSGL